MRALFLRLALLGILTSCLPAAEPSPLPYRFLIVIGDQWKDPSSRLIEAGGEFPALVTLFKTWGLPFDILRLDQQRFDRYYLMDRDGRPRYGTIVWDAAGELEVPGERRLLTTLVQDHGVGLVALGDAVANPEVAALAGLGHAGADGSAAGLAWTGGHFITREFAGREGELAGAATPGSRVSTHGASAVATRDSHPFLTVRDVGKGGRVAWLDAHRDTARFGSQLLRDLFKRSLVWTQGYALYAEYPRSVMLFMDDIGTSDRTYLPYWHYRTLNEDDIRRGIIEPLKRHGATLMMDIITGYVDRRTHRILNPWRQQVIDELDGQTFHDYVSAKRGLDAGRDEGVLEIQCHGYTHMLPDLESPPGPFRNVPVGVGAIKGFDEEFGDNLRKKDVPAITQRFLMERGIENLREDFGVVPLFVINGGGGKSLSYPHHSARLAAEMGFGLGHFNAVWYLGGDFALAMEQIVFRRSWAHDKPLPAADIPWTIDAPQSIVFHDRDVSIDPTAVERLLANLGPETRYVSANEYSGYLHARIARAPGEEPALTIDYDDHYCRHFANHPSKWVVHLSDDIRLSLPTAVPEKRTVTIPKGTGRHLVRLD
ncbi:MAG: hypothetical protein WD941_03630 [Opitutus sp.]